MTKMTYPTPLITPAELAALLDDPRVKLLDGTWYLPPNTTDPRAEYVGEHLPGAQFFDIDAIVATDTDLPHMLPTPEAFAKAVGQMGIGNEDYVVAYDRHGVFSAARVWWMFRVFGHTNVAVLDGGLPQWTAGNHPLSTDVKSPEAKTFVPNVQPDWVRSAPDVLGAIGRDETQIFDMRPEERYLAKAPEPRPGLRAGHIPSSKSLPWSTFLNPADNTLLKGDALTKLLADRNLDPDKATTCYCGSGIGACVATLAMDAAGIKGLSVYDGSWAEWGADENLPLER